MELHRYGVDKERIPDTPAAGQTGAVYAWSFAMMDLQCELPCSFRGQNCPLNSHVLS